MGLSDDQRAMLRLLAQRGEEGYDDVAALMGLSVEEVRAKVAEALAVLAEEGALAPQGAAAEPKAAEPPTPAAEPTPPPEPEPEPVAAPKSEPIPEPVAKAEPAAEPKPAPAVPAAARRKPSTPPKISFPSGNGPRAAIAAAAVVLVAIVVILIVSGGGSSDSSTTSASNTTSSQGEAEPEATPTSNTAEVTKAVLKPVAGATGSGEATFGRVKNSLVLQVEVKGLAPTTKGTEYAICIGSSPDKVLPIASTAVGSDGIIDASIKLPVELLLYLANETYSEIVITRANTVRLKAEIKRQSSEPVYTGTPVTRGQITGSLVGNDELLQQARELEKAE